MTSESDKKGLVVSFWNNLLQFFTFTKRHISFFSNPLFYMYLSSVLQFSVFFQEKQIPSFSKIDWKNVKIIIKLQIYPELKQMLHSLTHLN